MHGARRQAQTFLARSTGQLISAQVRLIISAAGNDFTVEIRTLDNTGKPTGTILGSTRIENMPVASASLPVNLIANFAPFAPVQAGTGYALVVTVDPGQGVALNSRSGTACPGQRLIDNLADGTFSPVSDALVYPVMIAA